MARSDGPNKIDKGSKLTTKQTRLVLLHLVRGTPAKAVAERYGISQNTVSAIGARFRAKLRSSRAFRQAAFELFYEHKYVGRRAYLHFLNFTDEISDAYFEDAKNCIFRCPAAFLSEQSKFSRLYIQGERTLLNLRQTERFLSLMPGGEFILRSTCTSCRATEGPINDKDFYALFKPYLKHRNLREDHVTEYFLQYSLWLLLFYATIHSVGVSWREDEVFLPPEDEWGDMPTKFQTKLAETCAGIVHYMCSVLELDPLGT